MTAIAASSPKREASQLNGKTAEHVWMKTGVAPKTGCLSVYASLGVFMKSCHNGHVQPWNSAWLHDWTEPEPLRISPDSSSPPESYASSSRCSKRCWPPCSTKRGALFHFPFLMPLPLKHPEFTAGWKWKKKRLNAFWAPHTWLMVCTSDCRCWPAYVTFFFNGAWGRLCICCHACRGWFDTFCERVRAWVQCKGLLTALPAC